MSGEHDDCIFRNFVYTFDRDCTFRLDIGHYFRIVYDLVFYINWGTIFFDCPFHDIDCKIDTGTKSTGVREINVFQCRSSSRLGQLKTVTGNLIVASIAR